MATIILNNEHEFQIDNFNRTLNFYDDTMSGSGYCNIVNTNAADVSLLGNTPITSIKIRNNNAQVIYDVIVDAEITTINEYLNGENLTISVNFNFK